MAILGLDYGTKRIGVALSPDGKWVFERPVITVQQHEQVIDALKKLIDEEQVHAIVVGLPVSLSGKEGEQASLVRTFFLKLQKQFPKQSCILLDERLSTVQAQKMSKERGDRHVHHADSLAAKLLLEQYLAS